MSFLIDTDISSAFLKGDGRVLNRFIQHSGGLHLSTVSLAELYSWVYRANTSAARLQGLNDLLSDMILLDVDQSVAQRFGEVRASLLDRGTPAPAMDLLIASTALVHDLTLVTHNTKDYVNIPRLRVADWLTP